MKHTLEKIKLWVVDYTYMVRGAIGAVIYRKPPHHYLGYTIDEKVSVILIPGIFSKWSFMKSLGDAISREGHPVYIVPELGFNLHSIPQSAKTLHLFILSIFIEKKKTKIISEHALKAKTFINSQNIE